MSHPDLVYPEPVYHGDGGLANGAFRPTDHEPDIRYPSGGRAHYLATGAATGGLFGLYRWEMAGEPSGPGPHFHRTLTESFYVLSGTIRLFDGREWREGRPGDFLFVPHGGIHAFRNESGEPATMLILFAPGAPREGYFEGLTDPAFKDLDEAAKADFYLRHDNHWI